MVSPCFRVLPIGAIVFALMLANCSRGSGDSGDATIASTVAVESAPMTLELPSPSTTETKLAPVVTTVPSARMRIMR
jgi:hypothetical protein